MTCSVFRSVTFAMLSRLLLPIMARCHLGVRRNGCCRCCVLGSSRLDFTLLCIEKQFVVTSPLTKSSQIVHVCLFAFVVENNAGTRYTVVCLIIRQGSRSLWIVLLIPCSLWSLLD